LLSVRGEFKKPIPRFRQDVINGEFSIFLGDEAEVPSTEADCIGMERLSVYSAEHVEKRIQFKLGLLEKKEANFVQSWLTGDRSKIDKKKS
jgi:hypothetical protein